MPTEETVAKPEWGHKRQCQSCGARFYDMRKSPIACPACGTVLDPTAQLRTRRSRPAPVPVEVLAAKLPPVAVAVLDDEVELEEGVAAGEEDEEEDVIEDASELGEDDDVAEVVVDDDRDD